MLVGLEAVGGAAVAAVHDSNVGRGVMRMSERLTMKKGVIGNGNCGNDM